MLELPEKTSSIYDPSPRKSLLSSTRFKSEYFKKNREFPEMFEECELTPEKPFETESTTKEKEQEVDVKGIVCMNLFVVTQSYFNVGVKVLLQDGIRFVNLSFIITFVTLLFSVGSAVYYNQSIFHGIHKAKKWQVIMRSCIGVVAFVLLLKSLEVLSLFECQAVYNTNAIFASILTLVIYKERVSRYEAGCMALLGTGLIMLIVSNYRGSETVTLGDEEGSAASFFSQGNGFIEAIFVALGLAATYVLDVKVLSEVHFSLLYSHYTILSCCIFGFIIMLEALIK